MVSEKFADGLRKNQARNGLKSQGAKNLPDLFYVNQPG